MNCKICSMKIKNLCKKLFMRGAQIEETLSEISLISSWNLFPNFVPWYENVLAIYWGSYFVFLSSSVRRRNNLTNRSLRYCGARLLKNVCIIYLHSAMKLQWSMFCFRLTQLMQSRLFRSYIIRRFMLWWVSDEKLYISNFLPLISSFYFNYRCFLQESWGVQVG